jgi:hypothetical protein
VLLLIYSFHESLGHAIRKTILHQLENSLSNRGTTYSEIENIGVPTVKAYFNVSARHTPKGNNVLADNRNERLTNIFQTRCRVSFLVLRVFC